jgi:N-acetylmuramoyl-L-alanine amidase
MAPNGAVMRVLGRSGDWYNVQYNGTSGYANANYLVLQ